MHRAILRVVIVSIVAAIGLFASAALASAHPLGNFTVNAYSGITVTPGRIRVDYVVDLAEIPTFQEMARIDTDGDGTAEEVELSAWAAGKADELSPGLSLEVDGSEVSLRLASSRALLRPGQGGLEILRLEAGLVGEVPGSGRALYRDRNDEGRIGWREVTAAGGDGVAVFGSSVPTASLSDELRSYPQGLLSSPLDVRAASFDFGPGEQEVNRGTLPTGTGTSAGPGTTNSALAGLVATPGLSLPIVLLSLLAAFGVGALHAVAPGHGKTVTAAYMAGSSASVRQAVGAGVAVSVMHTASVVAVGAVVLLAERAFPAERVYPWLGLGAGAVALALGGGLLVDRLRARRRGHEHPHDHPPLSRRGLAGLAMSGGLLPSPTALVALLGAVSLGRVAFGFGLIAAFGVGLAAALAAVGVLAVRARDVMSRRLPEGLVAALPMLSAAAILIVGVVLAVRGLGQL